jgi:hypothetical protein
MRMNEHTYAAYTVAVAYQRRNKLTTVLRFLGFGEEIRVLALAPHGLSPFPVDANSSRKREWCRSSSAVFLVVVLSATRPIQSFKRTALPHRAKQNRVLDCQVLTNSFSHANTVQTQTFQVANRTLYYLRSTLTD